MKKKWIKKLFALILIFTTVMSLLPTSILAENTTNMGKDDAAVVSDETNDEDTESDIDPQAASVPEVQCYISKDGAWTLVDTVSATGTASFNGSTRNYISAKSLEDVFGKYGYQVSDLAEYPKIFPHASTSSSEWRMWCDVDPVQDGDDYKIPLTGTSTSGAIRLYYCPNNKNGWPGYFSGNTSLTSGTSLNVNGIKTVKYYVAINGAWKELTDSEQTVTYTVKEFGDYSSSSNNTRYYVTSDRLGEVYKDYGFDADSYTGEQWFAHAASTDLEKSSKIWSNINPVKNGDTYDIPLAQYGSFNEIDVFYAPDTYYGSSVVYTDSTLLQKESFYTVEVEDADSILTEDQKEQIQGIDGYVFSGEAATVVVPAADNILWKVKNKATGAKIDSSAYTKTKNKDGTITFTFSEVTEPIQIQCIKKDTEHVTINYNATVEDSLGVINSYEDGVTNKQTIIEDGKIQGQTAYSTIVDRNKSYDILSPDDENAWVSCYSGNRKFAYYFAGWKVKGTERVYQEESEMTKDDITNYANDEGEIDLEAVWKLKDSNGRAMTVNFFVGLDSEIRDTDGNGFSPQDQNNFSGSVWASTIEGTDNVSNYYNTNDKYECQIIASSTSANAYSVDKTLRKGETDAIDPGVIIDSFPTDEEVFKKLREGGYTVTVDGQAVDSSELTTDHFTVRWYVLKYQHEDAWHIDGVLVSKEGKMTIKKTFSGDEDAINQIKENGYNISVSHTATITDDDGNTSEEEIEDYVLTTSISSSDEDSSTTNLGYSSYDKDTNTYTWIITGRQARTYKIKENNYKMDSSDYVTTALYRIANSDTDTDNSWKKYTADTEFSVVMPVYESDIDPKAFQSAQFQNTYIKKGKIAFHKVDNLTQLGMSNVSFKLSKENGGDVVLYRDPDHPHQYSADEASAALEGYTEKVEDNTVITDGNGYFTLKLPADSTKDTYTLSEVVPIGYEKQNTIFFKTDSSGNLVGTDTDAASGYGTKHMTIKNTSKLLTTVIAKKEWDASTSDDAKLPVTVELWRDGVKMSGDEYTQVLSADNNWTYTWHDLPLFTDGEVAEYKLKEVKIGDTKYDMSVDEESGFADYVISYADPLYKVDSEGDYTHLTGYWQDDNDENVFANSLLLSLANSQKTAEISFTKVNEDGQALRGATFALYSDENCTKKIEQAKSNSHGIVKFKTNKPGIYYIKELEAPNGYKSIEDTFIVKISHGEATIINPDGDIITEIVNSKAKVYGWLPNTGGHGYGLILQGAIACIAVICIIKKKKVHKKHRNA